MRRCVLRRLSEAEKSEIWDRFEGGESQRSISRRLKRPPSTIRSHLLGWGFRRPLPGPEWSTIRLSLTEREEISRGLATGESMRCIAARLGRVPSTVSREVAAGGGRDQYRATVAHRASRHRAQRPKPAKLATNFRAGIRRTELPTLGPATLRATHLGWESRNWCAASRRRSTFEHRHASRTRVVDRGSTCRQVRYERLALDRTFARDPRDAGLRG